MNEQSVTFVETASFKQDGLVVIDGGGAVWLTHQKPWWDIVGNLRWMLTSGLKLWLVLRTREGKRIRIQAVRLAKNYVRMG